MKFERLSEQFPLLTLVGCPRGVRPPWWVRVLLWLAQMMR